jgi:hypothetical protein
MGVIVPDQGEKGESLFPFYSANRQQLFNFAKAIMLPNGVDLAKSSYLANLR